jgi:hypothetical protein
MFVYEPYSTSLDTQLYLLLGLQDRMSNLYSPAVAVFGIFILLVYVVC